MRKEKGGRGSKKDGGYRINQDIKAPEVRLIGSDGKLIGVMSSREAQEKAEDLGLDLIEIAPNAKPPTCKIMDYGKWKYENKKKLAIAKKKQVTITVKEIQIRPRTDQHDLDVKMNKAKKFLMDGNKVKVNLRFHGREMAHQELGLELLEKVTKILEELSVVEVPPKKEGRQMFILIAPDAAKIKEYETKKDQPTLEVEASEAN